MTTPVRLRIQETRQNPVLQLSGGVRGPRGIPGGTAPTYSFSGPVLAGAGEAPWVAPEALTIANVISSVGPNDAPTSQDLILNLMVNGSPAFSAGNRPRIPIGDTVDFNRVPDLITALAPGDVLTVDVDQADGANLTVQVIF